ncbi:zinc finger protein 845-like isoform X3 [Teleopsis dalmanni]|uniref:zinc finger protein 845-like isoform X3 n=1 Tax=Teleopsis dalmanni TaxID=139649 RepID=UPI0018CD619F|nr:zinc finger protein 845-like isoform X3 [Teleopsis dalmanni]
MEEDWRLVCRTCLASDADFYNLNAPLSMDVDDDEKITHMECLRFCTRLDDQALFPIYICAQCSSSLQVSYRFIQNALRSHTILSEKILPLENSTKEKLTNDLANDSATENEMRFRCKICSLKVSNKKSLKEHVKSHLDIISFSCQLCDFETKKRSLLCEHYEIIHGCKAKREELKPKTNFEAANSSQTDNQIVEVYKEVSDIENLTTATLPEQQIELQYSTIPEEWDATQIANVLQDNTTQIQQISNNTQIHPTQINLHQISTEQQFQTQLLPQQFATNIDAAQLSNVSEYNIGNDLTIGNEFVVMADGTMEEVMSNGVVIEYIDAVDGSVTLDNNLVLNNLLQVGTNDGMGMDVDDIIIEENVASEIAEDNLNGRLDVLNSHHVNDKKNAILISDKKPIKKINCKICTEVFPSQDILKNHMLTHNEIPHFFCDQCSFYTFFKDDLTQHYKTKHKLQPTQKQLQPKNRVELNEKPKAPPVVKPVNVKHVYVCDLCFFETDIRNNLRRHYLVKHQVEANDVQLRPSLDETDMGLDCISDHNSKSTKTNKFDYTSGIHCKKCNKVFYKHSKLKAHYKDHDRETAVNVKGVKLDSTTAGGMNVEATVTSAIAIDQHMPADAIPQVVETDNIADIEFDFNGDVLFEDFDDDNDNDDIENLLLTSDDDFEDLLEEQAQDTNTNNNQEPLCMHCNKKFFSQYQFENHMFIHRGLAPYRCEMCTNLYNTKRALIKHYKAIHNRIPTRDMIQAKGDIQWSEKMPIDFSNLKKQKETTLMCGKCPFDSTNLSVLKNHLKEKHETIDDKFILQKLMFECPRCVRSFATKNRLLRHLDRSHSSEPIIQQRDTIKEQVSVQKATSSSSKVGKDHISLGAAQSEKLKLLLGNDIDANETELKVLNESQLYTGITEPSSLHTTLDINIKQLKTSITNNSHKDITSKTTTDLTTSTTYEKEFDVNNANDKTKDSNSFVIREERTSCNNDDIDIIIQYKSESDPLDSNPEDICAVKQNISSKEKDYRCHVCNGTYKTLMSLKYHSKRHMERQYQCNTCSKSFVERYELQQHNYTHTGELPHKCDICGKKFRYSFHLKRHKDVQHLGKRFVCSVEGCGKIFTQSFQLKIHAWSHNGYVPYKCVDCGIGFKKRVLLRAHVKAKHNKILNEEDIFKADEINDDLNDIIEQP